jgi:hypothetical protein
MKAEFDKEIDSLLRRGASRARAASVETGAGGAHAAHLDADEQSAYAENALPATARAHYAAHLADCDDCRRSVTQLALAAGMPAQLEAREKAATGSVASPVASWRARLGALFAPRAWRYAVPALALLLVSAVSLVVLTRRTQRETATTIARRNTTETPSARPSASLPPSETHHAPQNGNAAPLADATPGESATVAPDSDAPAPKPGASPLKEEIAANSPRTQAVQPLTAVDEPPPPPMPSSAGGAAGAARTVSESPTPTLMPPAVSDAVTVTSDQQAAAKTGAPVPALQRAEQKPGEFENRQRERIGGPRRNEQARNARAAEADASRDRADKEEAAPATAAPTATARRTRAPERGRDENRAAEDSRSRDGNESPAETRTVAGRKFRRQGGAWIDTAYNAGQPATAVRRNSEQFRALVADEPELRRIAGALGGEVTVVWKGRAYRIR